MEQEEITLDLKEILTILMKRKKIIISITLICTILSGIISFFVMKPVYEANESIVVGKQSSKADKESVNYNDVVMYQKLVKTYAQIAKSNYVAQKTVDKLKLDMKAKEFQEIVKVTPQPDTQIIDIKFTNTDAALSAKITETLTEVFIERAKQILPDGEIQILDKAKIPEKPIKPRKKLNVAIAFFLGLMVSVGAVFVLEYMDNTMKTEEDIKKYLDIPIIGTIPEHMVE